MLSDVDIFILKELDRQNIRQEIVSLIMKKLDDRDKKNKFLSYMIDNRNLLLSYEDIFTKVKELQVF